MAAPSPLRGRSRRRSGSVRRLPRSSSAAATTSRRARAFLEGERAPHDPFLLGDMAEAVARIRAAIAAGQRICVHGDYDVDGICATALAVLTLRELGAEVEWHLPSRFEEGYGVSGETISRLADEGVRSRAHRRLRDHRRRRGRSGEGARPRGGRHRPPPAGRDPAGLPDRRDAAVRLSVPRAVRDGRRPQAGAGAARRRPPGGQTARRPRRARDDRRRRAAGRREPRRSRSPACARSRARRSRGCAR